MNKSQYKILAVSTPIGAIGTGLGGGVELTLLNLVKEITRRGHCVDIVAPEGSVMNTFSIKEITGTLQVPAQNQKRTEPISIPCDSVLANMWDYAYQVQLNYDIIINFAYDWLPLYLTPFFKLPIAHLISMSSLSDAMDDMIEKIVNRYPTTIAVHGQTQASTFSFSEKLKCLKNGMDLSVYQFCDAPKTQLAWVGRIAPEKGLEDAIIASVKSGISLKIFGLIQDTLYWQQICEKYNYDSIEYKGFLSTINLQKEVGQCLAILITPKWIEAYPNVAIEALACGVPLIAYRRGGLTEIVQHGTTGWLVEPDNIDGLVNAISSVDQINRLACRQQAELEYSLQAFGDRVENWLTNIVKLNSF